MKKKKLLSKFIFMDLDSNQDLLPLGLQKAKQSKTEQKTPSRFP